MEEESWLQAAQKVLQLSQKPLHYTEIKKIILDQGLVSPGLKTTLEEALFKEIQRPGGRFKSIIGQPGVFGLVNPAIKTEPVPSSPQQLSVMISQGQKSKVKVTGQGSANKVIAVSTSQGVKILGGVVNPQQQMPARSSSSVGVVRPPGGSVVVTARPPGGSNSSALNPKVQEKYKAKYKRLRKQTKNLIFINGALCDEVIALEEKIQTAKDERRYLLTRLLQHQAVTESLLPQSSSGGAASTTSSGATSTAMGSKHTAQSIAQILGEVEKRKKKTQPGLTASGKKKSSKEILEEPPKSKPKKPRSGANNRRICNPLPLDSLGRPVLPIELGSLTVYCIGEIVSDRPGFHSAEHIYPVGYCSTRVYVSVRNPEEQCLYTCKILDSKHGPKFDISPEDAPEMVFSGLSAAECHLKLLKAINQGRPTEIIAPAPHGADFFGLSHPTVQNLIQSCPGAKKCATYKWVRFEISKIAMADTHARDDPTVSVEALFRMIGGPTKAAQAQQVQQQHQASLRSLLTTSAPTT